MLCIVHLNERERGVDRIEKEGGGGERDPLPCIVSSRRERHICHHSDSFALFGAAEGVGEDKCGLAIISFGSFP